MVLDITTPLWIMPLETKCPLDFIHSLSTTLETELANLIIKHVPSAEMVRFAKNGTDATSAAIRVARAFTNKTHIAVGGYHGWQDWYIGSTVRNKGVPSEVSNLTHSFDAQDPDSLRKILEVNPSKFAAIILEPFEHSKTKLLKIDKNKGAFQRIRRITDI